MTSRHVKIFLALGILIPLLLCALLGSALVPHDGARVNMDKTLLSPSAEHWLGTDHLGRDVLSRLVTAARPSLLSVCCILALTLGLSLVIGSICGYVGGKLDTCIMRICDGMMVFPTMILALFFIGILGVGFENVILAIVLTHVAWYTRMVRGYVLHLRHKEYILAARAMGVGRRRILLRHIFPTVLVQMLVLVSLDVGHMLLHVAGLSFLGLGIQPPTAEWGLMLSEARHVLRVAPALMFYPGLMIFLTTAACNLLGESLQEYLDPHLRHTEHTSEQQ